ncbi:MAG: tRNA (adenosine(37)-N6)-threonylcarbamoyltransferase complex dimerization subunit type 1 TsaB [Woeseiaceae bacterium]|nr:tRNA (adenosine(37)-N6)-threonylcarbamoyltransferase complex dimerization subunit type 1 TsaB [Woeseiaceae bacterium]
MSLLALDTSSLACSVAVQVGDDIVVRHEEQAREHTRLLVPMISGLLQETGLSLHDLDAIVLGNGPGSFIGMRIAASVAQGLAFGAGIPIVPVSSMLAVAARVSAECDAGDVVVCQDAHMNEVYLGLYTVDDAGLPVTLGEERLHDQSPIPELRDDAGRFIAAGFGWQRYPALHEANAPYLLATSEVLHPSARYLLPAGRALLASGAAVSPQEVTPAYVRQTVAQKPPRARP